jgi:hypothetical protein
MQKLDAGCLTEHFHRQVRAAEVATAGVRNLSGSLFRIVHEILYGLVGGVARHREKIGIAEHARDRFELRHLV